MNQAPINSGMDWQGEVGRKWARLHALTDRAFSGLTQQMLERLDRMAGNAILDIGCGAGELSLALARQRPQARIVGVDLSADLVAAARLRAGERGAVTFAEADAATWRPADGFRPDLLVSRHGVMFFADPVAAFTQLGSIAAPSASLAFTCFRDRRLNPWASEVVALLPPELVTPADPLAPGPFAFARPERVAGILGSAGWHEVSCEPVDFAYIAGMGDDPVADARAFLGAIGPAAPAIAQIEGTAGQPAFEQRLAEWLGEYASGNLVAFPAAAWFVTARRD